MIKTMTWQVSFLVKLIGIVMIGMSAALIGYQLSTVMKKRIDMLCIIRFIMEEILNEASYGKEILPEVILAASLKVDGREKEWLLCLHEKIRISGEYDFIHAWKESLDVLRHTALKTEDIKIFESFGNRIINLNEDRLSGIVDNYVRTLDEHVNHLKSEYAIKSRLYRSMGILAGLFIIIIVI